MLLTITAAYIFYFFSLSKGIDDTQSFLGYVWSTKLSFHILFSSASRAHPSQEGFWWTEGSCSGLSIITRGQGCQWNAKRASTRKYLRGFGNLCSSAAYNQGWLTL